MCHVTMSAPGVVSEGETTAEFTSTYQPDTTTTSYDARQNEIDAKFSNGVETTTSSDIDGKIESIETDDAERSVERQMPETVTENVSATESTTELLLAELNESTTTEFASSTNTAPLVGETTLADESSQMPEAVEEIQEPRNNKQLEELATRSEEDESTTNAIDEASTTSKRTTEVALQQKSDVEDEIKPEKSVADERSRVLLQIRKMLKAHVLRALLTLLNEAKKRQQLQIDEQHVMESRVAEETFHSVSGSECECEGTDEVSTNDDDKVIAFDENLQRYVYTDKQDYKLMTGEHKNRSDKVRWQWHDCEHDIKLQLIFSSSREKRSSR